MNNLSSILGSNNKKIQVAWESSESAAVRGPVPAGIYEAKIVKGELHTSRHGTPGYKLTFEVDKGPDGCVDYTGQYLWKDLWLTSAAMPRTKYDLAKLGITDPKQLEFPLQGGIHCKLKVTLRQRDDGTEFNEVKQFDVLRIDKPVCDPFAPTSQEESADKAQPEGGLQ